MTKFVSIHANGDDGQVVTVTEAFAKGIGQKPLDYPALDSSGRPRPPRSKEEAEKQKAAADEAAKAAQKAEKTPASPTPTPTPNPGPDAGNR